MENKRKKKSKIKLRWIIPRWNLKYYKAPIFLSIGLLLFPVILGLIYKIPVTFIDIESGDLLSYYAVAFGLFASFLTYRADKEKKDHARKEDLRPKIELSFEFDNVEKLSRLCINNSTKNDYTINYVGLDIDFDDENERSLNAGKQRKFTLEYWDTTHPKRIQIGIKDSDNNEWAVEFEHQDGTNTYCRIFMDIIS